MKIKRKTFVGGLLATLCACATVITGLSLSSGNTVAASAATGSAPASILSLNGDFASKISGAQNENIYFGTNGSSGTVKWRVLDTGDKNKYGDGMLLWADKQLAAETYNSGPNQASSAQPNYAYWSTSKIRASLNGGSYPNSVTGTNMPNATLGGTITTDDSWYGKLFTQTEKDSVLLAGSYTTDNWGMDVSQAQYEYKTSNITATAYGENGKYNQNILGTGTATSAVKTSDNGVQETSSGDKLFLLDYYDINNTTLGFGDGSLTYAKKIDASWTESSGYYPGYNTGSGDNFNNKTSDYLKFSGESADYYWLRNAGRRNTSSSNALGVRSSGCMDDYNVSRSYGVRPAFNFNASNVVYATAASLTSMSTTLSSVGTAATMDDGKPAYKLYIKGTNYNANTNSAKSYMAVNDNVITIAYNNPADKASSNLVLLLSNSDGSVEYQAEQSVSGVISTALNTVTFTLPAGVTYSDYTATLLYTSANGGASSETVYCAYTLDSGVDIPTVFNTEYKNTNQWIGSLDSAKRPNWYNEKIHGNEAFVKVESIKYTDNIGTQTDVDVSISNISLVEAGTYKVTLALASGLKWSTGDSNDKTFNIVIAKAQPSVEVQTTGTLPTYAPDTLEEIGIALKPGGTAGTVAWKTGQLPTTGENVPYTWVFTPDVPNNYEEKEDTLKLTFKAREIDNVEAVFTPNGDIFTNTTEATLRDCTVVTITYKGTPVKTETTTNYEFLIDNDGVNYLIAGDNYFKVRVTDEAANGKKVSSALVKIEGVKELGYSTIDSLTFSGKTFTYPVTADDIIGAIRSATLIRNDGHTDDVTDAEEIKNIIVLTDDCDLNAGTSKSLKFKIAGAEDEKTYGGFTINQGTFDVSGITFTGNTDKIVYDGQPHKIEISGTLPTGVSVVYTVTGSATTYNAAGYTEAGTYNYTASFTHSNANYNTITATLPATLKIDKATVTGITFADDVKPEITGTTYTLEATGYPEWVTVEYYYGGDVFTGASAAGEYEITAKFTIDAAHANNYEAIAPITKTLTISDKPPVEGADDIVVEPTVTATYTGSPVDYAAQNVPAGVIVSYSILKDGQPFDSEEIIAAGVYTVTVSFDTGAAYAPIADKTCTVTVKKADVDMSGVKFADETVTGNGKPHVIEATDLPQGVTVEYEYKGVKQTAPFEFTEVGEYTVKAYFTYEDEDNYEAIEPVEATLTISDAVVESISANVEDGAKFDINGTLDDVKAKIKAEIHFNNGAKEQAKVEDLTITCATLREGGLLEVGTQTITVTYNDGENDFTTTVQIEVARAKVALPVYNGSLKYTGDTVKPAATDFEGFDSALMTLVESKTVAGLNAGAYKAVFALKDSERYQWARATTLKKAVFAVVYEEVVLEDYEAAVDWNLAKAKITATKANGKLPVFASESYTGSFAEVVGLKYYTDETCAEEVAADELGYSTKYYVKAELLDSANFELDETALTLSKTAFEYTTPEKQLTVWEKVVKFLTINWLWIVIAVVALILLILIIALAARAAKRKREREEQRRLEEKEEKKREQEEREERRREEREERMARMSQPQMMMPQMMPQMMGGQMPMQQAMPQQVQAQPVAAAGSASELAEIKAEISALRAEQNLRDVSALKAEQQVTQTKIDLQFANLLSRLGGEQVQGGISVNWLEEMVDKAVQKALAKNDKAEAQVAKPEGAAAQVPPDAVMTTVTTTKIDTTKKPVQSAAAPAPVRTVVRNIVAPMPVDDGRVFDVGGFYKPADPLTDNIDDVLGNEDKQD